MDVIGLTEGNNNRYYRGVAVTAERVFFESEYGLKEPEVLAEVG